jgi:hypothetical protein
MTVSNWDVSTIESTPARPSIKMISSVLLSEMLLRLKLGRDVQVAEGAEILAKLANSVLAKARGASPSLSPPVV